MTNLSFEMRRRYTEYMKSDIWEIKSREFIEEVGRCEKCGKSEKEINEEGSKLQCHHKKEGYKNLGMETLEDVQVLCESCHDEVHPRGKEGFVKKKSDSINEGVGRRRIFSEAENEILKEYDEQNPKAEENLNDEEIEGRFK